MAEDAREGVMRRIVVVQAILVTLLAIATRADAQAPSLSEVPPGITGPARAELIRQRAALMERRTAIGGKVGTHNQRCSAVAEGSPLEASCAKAQDELNAVIVE